MRYRKRDDDSRRAHRRRDEDSPRFRRYQRMMERYNNPGYDIVLAKGLAMLAGVAAIAGFVYLSMQFPYGNTSQDAGDAGVVETDTDSTDAGLPAGVPDFGQETIDDKLSE